MNTITYNEGIKKDSGFNLVPSRPRTQQSFSSVTIANQKVAQFQRTRAFRNTSEKIYKLC